MSRSRRIVVALFAVLAVVLAVCAGLVWKSLQPIVIELPAPTNVLALSPDGSAVAACGSVGGWICPAESGFGPAPREILFLWESPAVPRALVFSPDGELVYGVDSTHGVRAWSRASGASVDVPPLAGKDPLRWIALSPCGNLAVTLTFEHLVQLWSLSDGKLVRTVERQLLPTMGDVVDFSPSGKLAFGMQPVLVNGESEGLFRVWSVCDGRLIFEGGSSVDTTVLDPGNIWLEETSDGVSVFDGAADEERCRIPCESRHATAVSRDGELLALGSDSIELHSLPDGKLVQRILVNEPEPCTALAFSADFTRLAAAFAGGSTSGACETSHTCRAGVPSRKKRRAPTASSRPFQPE